MRISDWSSDVCSSDLVAEGSLVAGGVSGVLLSSEQMVVSGLTQGCTPIGAPHVITEAEGARGLVKTIDDRSEEHTSELQSLMRISYAVFCLNKKNKNQQYKTANRYIYATPQQYPRDT